MQYLDTQCYDYPTIKRQTAQFLDEKPLDIVFISNGETHAQRNWEILQKMAGNVSNRLVHVQGVKGRAEAYKAKKFRVEARTLAHELSEEHPNLSFSERYDIAWEMILDNHKSNISWKYLKEVSDAKVNSMKYQKLNKSLLNKLPEMNKEFRTQKEFFSELISNQFSI